MPTPIVRRGLRVVGDVARFVLDDTVLAQSWRSLRSDLWAVLISIPGLQRRGMESRDSVGDVGRLFQAKRHNDLVELTRTNIHRAQESFRVLEESFRGIDLNACTELSKLRYRVTIWNPYVHKIGSLGTSTETGFSSVCCFRPRIFQRPRFDEWLKASRAARLYPIARQGDVQTGTSGLGISVA
jgi:hypothetical protein